MFWQFLEENNLEKFNSDNYSENSSKIDSDNSELPAVAVGNGLRGRFRGSFCCRSLLRGITGSDLRSMLARRELVMDVSSYERFPFPECGFECVLTSLWRESFAILKATLQN